MLAEGLPDEVRDNAAVAEAYMGEGASVPWLTPWSKLDDLDASPATARCPSCTASRISVNAGQVAVLLGLNGAGKSTAVKALCGAVDSDGRRHSLPRPRHLAAGRRRRA